MSVFHPRGRVQMVDGHHIGGQETTDVEVSRAILSCTMVETPLSKVGVINEGAPTETGSQMYTRSSVV